MGNEVTTLGGPGTAAQEESSFIDPSNLYVTESSVTTTDPPPPVLGDPIEYDSTYERVVPISETSEVYDGIGNQDVIPAFMNDEPNEKNYITEDAAISGTEVNAKGVSKLLNIGIFLIFIIIVIVIAMAIIMFRRRGGRGRAEL